jgi:hypothetical protein
MVQHFRYRLKYVDDAIGKLLKSETEPTPPELKGASVVVVYLFQTQRAGLWQPAKSMGLGGPYLPLRRGKLINAFRDGGIAHFFFELGDYVNSDKDSSTRILLNTKIEFRLAPSKPLKSSYAHLSEDLEFPRSNDDTADFQSIVDWAYLPTEWRTRSLGSEPLDVTYDIVFFRISALFREENQRLVAVTPVLKSVQANTFAEHELQSGETYHMRIVTHLAPRLPSQLPGEGRAKLKLGYDPKIIEPLGPTTLKINSFYNLEYWSFMVKGAEPVRSALSVECDFDAASWSREDFVRKELLCPELFFPISIVSAK